MCFGGGDAARVGTCAREMRHEGHVEKVENQQTKTSFSLRRGRMFFVERCLLVLQNSHEISGTTSDIVQLCIARMNMH